MQSRCVAEPFHTVASQFLSAAEPFFRVASQFLSAAEPFLYAIPQKHALQKPKRSQVRCVRFSVPSASTRAAYTTNLLFLEVRALASPTMFIMSPPKSHSSVISISRCSSLTCHDHQEPQSLRNGNLISLVLTPPASPEGIPNPCRAGLKPSAKRMKPFGLKERNYLG